MMGWWVLIEYIAVKSVWRKGMWRRPVSKTILSSHLPTRDPRYWVWRQKPLATSAGRTLSSAAAAAKRFLFLFPPFPDWAATSRRPGAIRNPFSKCTSSPSTLLYSLDMQICIFPPGLRLLSSAPPAPLWWLMLMLEEMCPGAQQLFSLFHVQSSNAQTGADGGGRPGPGRHITTCWLS